MYYCIPYCVCNRDWLARPVLLQLLLLWNRCFKSQRYTRSACTVTSISASYLTCIGSISANDTSDDSDAPPEYSPISQAPSSNLASNSESSSSASGSSIHSASSSTGEETPQTINPPLLPTYKLVGDNLDKHVKPREMRIDVQAESLHLFSYYAVRDRVDCSHLPDSPCLPDKSTFCVEKMLLFNAVRQCCYSSR